MRILSILFHGTGLLHYIYGLYYRVKYVVPPTHLRQDYNLDDGFGGAFKFFTVWNVVVQLVYFSLCLTNDIIRSEKKRSDIQRVVDFMFASMAVPFTVFVGVAFWSICAYDRELMFPRVMDEFYPGWLNHLMHTNIMFFMLADMLLYNHQYPSRKHGVLGFSIFILSYYLWVYAVYVFGDMWIYPVVAVLNWSQRGLFITALYLIMLSAYFIGEHLNRRIWGTGKRVQRLENGKDL